VLQKQYGELLGNRLSLEAFFLGGNSEKNCRARQAGKAYLAVYFCRETKSTECHFASVGLHLPAAPERGTKRVNANRETDGCEAIGRTTFNEEATGKRLRAS